MTAASSRPDPARFGIGRLFDLVGEAVIVADAATGRIELWNEAATRLFGHDVDDAIGMPVSVLVPDDLKEAHRAGLARFAASHMITLTPPGHTIEVPAVTREGTRLWIDLSLNPLDGEHVLALLRDVTDRHAAQVELARANQILKDFVAVAAHDLRSPITALTAAIELLAEVIDADPTTETGELLDIAKRQAANLRGLVDDLLDTAGLDAGTVLVTPEAIEVAASVGAAVAGFPAVETDIPPGLSWIVDRRHAQRIITNLVVNGVRHGRPPVVITARRVGATVELAVTDEGEGVRDDTVDRLFVRYERGPSSSGTGLGLPIALGLAEANGGTVAYAPDASHRSRFVLTLPVAD